MGRAFLSAAFDVACRTSGCPVLVAFPQQGGDFNSFSHHPNRNMGAPRLALFKTWVSLAYDARSRPNTRSTVTLTEN